MIQAPGSRLHSSESMRLTHASAQKICSAHPRFRNIGLPFLPYIVLYSVSIHSALDRMSDPTASSSSSSSADAPPAALQAPSDRSARPQIIGDGHAGPSSPFPIYLSGVVQRGFGRGGKELGCPTANLPSRLLKAEGPTRVEEEGGGGGEGSSDLGKAPTGVYFGWARLISAREGGRGEEYEDKEQKEKKVERDAKHEEGKSAVGETSHGVGADLKDEECVPLPMVMSLGWNPFYANKTKTAVSMDAANPHSQEYLEPFD